MIYVVYSFIPLPESLSYEETEAWVGNTALRSATPRYNAYDFIETKIIKHYEKHDQQVHVQKIKFTVLLTAHALCNMTNLHICTYTC